VRIRTSTQSLPLPSLSPSRVNFQTRLGPSMRSGSPTGWPSCSGSPTASNRAARPIKLALGNGALQSPRRKNRADDPRISTAQSFVAGSSEGPRLSKPPQGKTECGRLKFPGGKSLVCTGWRRRFVSVMTFRQVRTTKPQKGIFAAATGRAPWLGGDGANRASTWYFSKRPFFSGPGAPPPDFDGLWSGFFLTRPGVFSLTGKT